MKNRFKYLWTKTKQFFKYIIDNLKDWKTFIIFAIVCLIVGSEVWVSYVIAFIVGFNTPLGITLTTFATSCIVFWNLPFTPFLATCFAITMVIKKFINNKLRKKELDDKRNKSSSDNSKES